MKVTFLFANQAYTDNNH